MRVQTTDGSGTRLHVVHPRGFTYYCTLFTTSCFELSELRVSRWRTFLLNSNSCSFSTLVRFQDDGLPPDGLLLRIHAPRLRWPRIDDRGNRCSICGHVCPRHLLQHQSRLISFAQGRTCAAPRPIESLSQIRAIGSYKTPSEVVIALSMALRVSWALVVAFTLARGCPQSEASNIHTHAAFLAKCACTCTSN
jgi:hypothetical protein